MVIRVSDQKSERNSTTSGRPSDESSIRESFLREGRPRTRTSRNISPMKILIEIKSRKQTSKTIYEKTTQKGTTKPFTSMSNDSGPFTEHRRHPSSSESFEIDEDQKLNLTQSEDTLVERGGYERANTGTPP